MAFAILWPGIASTTGFEGTHGPTNYPTDHVRRRRNAAVPAFARGPSQTVPALVRRALDVPGTAVAGLGYGAVRTSDPDHKCRLSFHGDRATDRNPARSRRAARADAAR